MRGILEVSYLVILHRNQTQCCSGWHSSFWVVPGSILVFETGCITSLSYQLSIFSFFFRNNCKEILGQCRFPSHIPISSVKKAAILRYNHRSRRSGVWIYHKINQRISYKSTTQALRDELWRQLILLNDISRNHGNEPAHLSRFNTIKWTCPYAKCYARCSFACKEL